MAQLRGLPGLVAAAHIVQTHGQKRPDQQAARRHRDDIFRRIAKHRAQQHRHGPKTQAIKKRDAFGLAHILPAAPQPDQGVTPLQHGNLIAQREGRRRLVGRRCGVQRFGVGVHRAQLRRQYPCSQCGKSPIQRWHRRIPPHKSWLFSIRSRISVCRFWKFALAMETRSISI